MYPENIALSIGLAAGINYLLSKITESGISSLASAAKGKKSVGWGGGILEYLPV